MPLTVNGTVRSLSDFLSEPAKRWPDREAVSDGKHSLTFKELDQASHHLARFLISEGVGVNQHVAILAPKEVSVVIAIAACLKAGITYVPIEPTNPVQRIEYLISDIKPAYLIMPSSFSERLNPSIFQSIPVIHLEQVIPGDCPVWGEIPIHELELPLEPVEDSTLAYCMYTSGSTGEPKGVQVEHKSVLSFIQTFQDIVQFDECSVCLNTSAFNFDVSIEDVFAPLYYGSRVFLYSGLMYPTRFFDILEREKITHLIAISSTITLMAGAVGEFQERDLSQLKVLLTGGEVLNVNAIQTWLREVPGIRLYNAYGPTETTCVCVIYPITEIEPDRTEFYPIGLPLRGVSLRIVDEEGNTLGPDEEGELLIGGTHVMRGYWNRPELTASRTVTIDGIRYYKSGDVARIDPQGICHYLGRRDDEVKVFGYRINLNEVRNALISVDHVADGVVAAIEDKQGKVLVAAIICKDSMEPSFGADVIRQISLKLPNYMIPRAVLLCRNFPAMTTAKTDVKKIVRLIQSKMAESSSSILLQTEDWDA
ncbi:amino acid adenylation domain-containing protein [Paenibacillus lutrae]|uniref:Amino acid adenylation domain-containing protein n=1 Tax=Paenibacillus lutrae TaxID=2078573 RepID=A0A7X3FLS0_9BACL|nr:amino acid adenylation domain-containing protein [Paenibacillus lutrae]MVP01953.1 amino acid adenylation domain-containing protein [Paenibacillus lutrae]